MFPHTPELTIVALAGVHFPWSLKLARWRGQEEPMWFAARWTGWACFAGIVGAQAGLVGTQRLLLTQAAALVVAAATCIARHPWLEIRVHLFRLRVVWGLVCVGALIPPLRDLVVSCLP